MESEGQLYGTYTSKQIYRMINIAFYFLNCLAGTVTNQNFIIGCWYFLKKHKLLVRTKTLLFVASIFLLVNFLFPCDFVVICLCPTYRVMMV